MPRLPVWLRYVLAAFCAALVAFLALRSSPYLQYIPWMPRSVGVWADSHGLERHLVGFFALGLAVFLLLGRGLILVLAAASFAALLEVAQLGIRGRSFDQRDLFAGVLGVLLAWPVAWLLHRTVARRC